MKKRGSKKPVTRSISSKKSSKKNLGKNGSIHPSGSKHPAFKEKLTLGQRAADKITEIGGSWIFIGFFFLFLFAWMGINAFLIKRPSFDPYPYILLNLVLSCLAAVQAPIILMAQNRQTQRDRIDERYDHIVNRKAEREIQGVQKQLIAIKHTLWEMKQKK